MNRVYGNTKLRVLEPPPPFLFSLLAPGKLLKLYKQVIYEVKEVENGS